MPIEMRELIIKTEIRTRSEEKSMKMDSQEIKTLKQQIINECLQLIKDKKDKDQRNSFNR
ncbi:MAG: DUF5908 family protein [Methylococcales bacterium]|nr:DUF5908 family protein [Methylococcales bacterium]